MLIIKCLHLSVCFETIISAVPVHRNNIFIFYANYFNSLTFIPINTPFSCSLGRIELNVVYVYE